MTPRDLALAFAIVLLWGCNFVVMKHAVSEVPPLLLTALRFGLAALPAVFFVKRPDIPWRVLIAFATAFGIVKFSLLFIAFKIGMPAGLASIVLQLHAFFAVMLAFLVFAERPSRAQWAGLALALAGLAVIGVGTAGSATLWPFALTIAAAAAWACASMIAKHAGRIDMLGFTVWMSLVPPLPMLALSLVFEGPAAINSTIANITPLGIAAVLYLAYPVSVFSIAAWSHLLSRHPAAAVVPFSLLVPLIGVLSGRLVYGETIDQAMLAGGALILLGLAATVLGAGVRSAARPTAAAGE